MRCGFPEHDWEFMLNLYERIKICKNRRVYTETRHIQRYNPPVFIMMVPELQRLDKQIQQYGISEFWVERHVSGVFLLLDIKVLVERTFT